MNLAKEGKTNPSFFYEKLVIKRWQQLLSIASHNLVISSKGIWQA